MLTGADEIEILAFDLVHHGIHLCKTHNAGYYIAADHKGRYTVGKAAANHKVSCVGDHGRVKSGNITHQIVKAIPGHFSGSVQINAVKTLHNVCMVRNLKLRNCRLSELFDLYILAVIFSNGDAWVNDIRDRHHDL